MTIALASERARSFSEIFFEPYDQAERMFERALRVDQAALSRLGERARFNLCEALIDLVGRVTLFMVGFILSIPLVNIVALQILRLFDCSCVRLLVHPGVSNEDNDETFRLMSNQGKVLIAQDRESLPPATQAEYTQRKEALIDALTNPGGFVLGDFRCVNEVSRFDLAATLAGFRTDYDHARLAEFFDYAEVSPNKRADLTNDLSRYSYEFLNNHQTVVKNCLSRLYDFLNQKKALFQDHPKEALFKAEIRHIFDQICNAHLNCVDQVGAQIESIMVRTIASYEIARVNGAQTRTALLRSMAALALFEHKLRLISTICVKEFPDEPHFVVIEREAKRILANELGLTGDIVQAGGHYASMIVDMEMKARHVVEIFKHGRPLETYQGLPVPFRRVLGQNVNREENYAADQYRPERFLMGGSTLSYGQLISFGTSILQWAMNYFNLEADNDQTRQCIELISANRDGMTADMGGDLRPEAILYFLNHLGILERRVN